MRGLSGGKGKGLQSVCGSETWPMKIEDMQRLERAERMMVRWMCGVTLKNRISSKEVYSRLNVECGEKWKTKMVRTSGA